MRRALPQRPFPELLEAFPTLRQSLLGESDNCMLMTLFGLTGHKYNNPAQARGILFHRIAAEALRTMWRVGAVSIEVSEMLEIMYEVCAQRDVPPEDIVYCTSGQRRLLRICCVSFAANNEFHMDKLIDVERRLFGTVRYPHPETGEMIERRITGQPDALVADPPEGAIVLDWKTTLKAPPRYTGNQPDTDAGVSYMGYFQQRNYALLVMQNYPAVERVTLREFYPLDRDDPVRKATVTRNQLEHIEREMANLCEQLDRALMGGAKSKLWLPTPGHHCTYCPRPTSCPIDPEERAIQGGVTSLAQARKVAAEYVLAKTIAGTHHETLKAIVAEHGPIPVKSAKGRYEIGWQQNKSGKGRTFGMHVPTRSDRGPEDPDLASVFESALERKKAA